MTKLSKILNGVLFALLGVTVVFIVMFYVGGNIPDQAYETPVYTDLLINWGIILVFASIIITLLFELFNIITNPAGAKMTLMSILAIAVVFGVAYALASDVPLQLGAYEGGDNVPSMLKMAGTLLNGTYLLMAIIIVVIFGTEISRIFK